MSEPLPHIDLQRIRTYDGAQSGGFEQLAVDLFAREYGVSRRLVRVNGSGGDGGVEAFADVSGKGTIGMQAKLFDHLGETQWKQITKSVTSALNEHPGLTEYRIYTPLDRTKGRRGKTKGGVEKWNQHVKSWQNLPNGPDVEFVWVGRHEIELTLKNAANHDLLFYWFGTPQFAEDWMDGLLTASLKTLAERYQPDRHVDESRGRELDRFVWSPLSERSIEAAYVDLAESCLSFTQDLQALTFSAENEGHRAVVKNAIDHVVRSEFPAHGIKTVHQLRPPAVTLLDHVRALASYLRNQQSAMTGRDKERLDSFIRDVESFDGKVGDWVDVLDQYSDADHQCALVKGDAGNGKSHLIAHCAVQARRRKQPVLLFLGEQFLGNQPPLVQLCAQIGWSGQATSLLSALNIAGSLAQRPALLFIDALNESTDRRLWKGHLHTVATAVQRYPHVRLVVSCRSDFVHITLPNDFKNTVPAGWGLIEHHGFGEVLADAVARYFKSYNIRSPHFPPLLDEFRNPLFLDTFCRAFENQMLPDGPITLQTVMERRITRLAQKIQEDTDCDEHHVRAAIHALAEKIRENSGSAVAEHVARAVIEPHSSSSESSRSLYTHLLSNRIILERVDHYWEGKSAVVVRFSFERFSDYFVARGLLDDVADNTALRELMQDGHQLDWTRAPRTYYPNRGIARALAILVPEKFRLELVDLLPAVEHRNDLLIDLLDSLPWRSGSSITASTQSHFVHASRLLSKSSLIETLLRTATIPQHPFNADYLHGKLAALTLARRDIIWTIPISQLAAYDETVPATLVEWAIRVPVALVSDDQAALVATVLLWFGSSNRVDLRARAGLAAIRILIGRPKVTKELVEKFDGTDDPYVVERLYAVACGVAMREPQGDGLRELAATVHRPVFATSNVRPHVLLRDYAQTLLFDGRTSRLRRIVNQPRILSTAVQVYDATHHGGGEGKAGRKRRELAQDCLVGSTGRYGHVRRLWAVRDGLRCS